MKICENCSKTTFENAFVERKNRTKLFCVRDGLFCVHLSLLGLTQRTSEKCPQHCFCVDWNHKYIPRIGRILFPFFFPFFCLEQGACWRIMMDEALSGDRSGFERRYVRLLGELTVSKESIKQAAKIVVSKPERLSSAFHLIADAIAKVCFPFSFFLFFFFPSSSSFHFFGIGVVCFQA
jgi:hypothetical protein